jgi:hypothetical protein
VNFAFQIRLGSGSEALKVFKPFYVATGITLTYSNKGTLHQMQENLQQESGICGLPAQLWLALATRGFEFGI